MSRDITPLYKVRQDDNRDGIPDLLGDTVTVSGIATIGSGLLHKVYLQIFIQDGSTGLALFSESIDTAVSPGDSIVAMGTVQQKFGQTGVEVEAYRVFRASGKIPGTKPLARAAASPEMYEGMLVSGSGQVIGKGSRYNGKYLSISPSDSISNSLVVYVSNFHRRFPAFDFESLSPGDEVRIKGILSSFTPGNDSEGSYRVYLRTPDDLDKIGIAPYTLVNLGIAGLGIIGVVVVWIVSLRTRVNSKTRQIRRSLEEKELLLKEIHHRVKNNLAIISGLIELQLYNSDSEEVRKVLRDSQTRIQSMALVHDKLYRTNTLSEIDMNAYIRELVETLKYTFSGPDSNVNLEFEIEEIELDVDRAIPCGLLVNELVVNAFKHAFNFNGEGELQVGLKNHSGQIELTVADNGRGMPGDFDEEGNTSFGKMLITTFSNQLGAEMSVENRQGAHLTFRFPKEPPPG